MTAQSLLVVLREQRDLNQANLDSVTNEEWGRMWHLALLEQRKDLNAAVRVIEEVLRSTRETRKELGDPTLEAATGSGGDLGLGSSTPR